MNSRAAGTLAFIAAAAVGACCCPAPVDVEPVVDPAPAAAGAEPTPAEPPPAEPTPELEPLPVRDWPGCEDIGYEGVKMLGLVDPERERQRVWEGVRYTVQVDQDHNLEFTGDDGSSHTVRLSRDRTFYGSIKAFSFGDESVAVLVLGGRTEVKLAVVDPVRWRLVKLVSLPLADDPARQSNERSSRGDLRFGVDEFAVSVERDSILNWFQVDESGEIREEKHLYTSTYARPKLAMVDGTWGVLAGKHGDFSGYHLYLIVDPASGDDAIWEVLWAEGSGVGNDYIQKGDLVGQDGAFHVAGWHGDGKFARGSVGQMFHVPASGGDVETNRCEMPR